jgi:hypothetical protein
MEKYSIVLAKAWKIILDHQIDTGTTATCSSSGKRLGSTPNTQGKVGINSQRVG